QVRFTILDPVGLGENFAGFMHASDYDEALVGRRIWTDAAQIQQQLMDLTDHMENVIQKYLRNEYDTIEQYNRQAGELAEPYRFLVIADFPTNFNEESARRLRSIINSGARCGVYTLILRDTRHELPPGINAEDLVGRGVRVVWRKGLFTWDDEVFGQFALELDAPPEEQQLTTIMHKVGEKARDAGRVEVPFEVIAPAENDVWSLDSGSDLHVPLGRTGATRLQSLRLGHGVAQHTLIAGKTGSGKSTLLHVIITNLALWYSPREVEMYLIDFKRGVEFKTYVTHHLPHARAIAVESDREFGLSVLQRLDAEMARRGELFRQAGVQDLAGYRQATGQIMPRTVLIVDEFQVFFTEDDKLAQDAAGLLEQLVRQGRAFGVHVLLGSQTLSGASGLARSTLGQMAVRIALQCSETDSHLILDDDNVAARLLSRPGEAIYNETGGRPEGNSPFQISWLDEDQRDNYLGMVRKHCEQINYIPPRPAIFEGNVPARLEDNFELTRCWRTSEKDNGLPLLWLGEPVAIKEPTHIILRDQSGAQVLMIGQQPAAAMGITHSMLASLTAQQSPDNMRIIFLDGTPADAPFAGRLEQWLEKIPHPTQVFGVKDVANPLNELSEHLKQRQHDDAPAMPRIYLVVFGLQRFRDLRRSEDDFSFSLDADASAPKPDKQFIEIIREGPAVGIHTLVWADSMAGLERCVDRASMREFDNLVLFQMSAADSSLLIDSPAANTLGPHRALLFSEERGTLEKFRPYAPPDEDLNAGLLENVLRKWAVG
ncbi:MAG: hypothetical protein JW709_01820, partial [Sedimentisphaerales bacterium]|nr:hypothetical protein [Sedimentisphaerales bacterium]